MRLLASNDKPPTNPQTAAQNQWRAKLIPQKSQSAKVTCIHAIQCSNDHELHSRRWPLNLSIFFILKRKICTPGCTMDEAINGVLGVTVKWQTEVLVAPDEGHS